MIKCKQHEDFNKDCPTCKSLNYHNSIYKELNNKESLMLFRERTLKAFGGLK